MKICFGLGGLFFSGAENVVRYLIEELIKNDHEVSAILITRLPENENIIPGLTIKSAIVKGSRFVSVPKRVCAIRNSLKELQPDIFVIFSFATAFTAVPASINLPGVKTIVCERNPPECVPKSKLRKFARDFMFRFADACVSQTEVIAGYFRKIVKENFVIPNPIRIQGEMCPDIEDRKKIFATVARLDDYQKNQSMMIEAFAKVASEYPEYELHFLGNGPDLEKYRKLVSDLGLQSQVKFLGNISEPLEYIKNCRAFLLTSNYEGMPNALIEAMSIGLPCISTDCSGGGAAYLINNRENGILISKSSETELVDSMKMIIECDDLCKEIGKNAYKINQKLAGDVIVQKWIDVFREIKEDR